MVGDLMAHLSLGPQCYSPLRSKKYLNPETIIPTRDMRVCLVMWNVDARRTVIDNCASKKTAILLENLS